MSDKQDIPFNIELLNITSNNLMGLRPIRSLDITDGASDNFHPDGLFSTVTFGKVGDERRSTRFSYIDIKVPIFHPVVFRALSSLKRLYTDIMAGTAYAIFDEETKDFERSDPINGETGYNFFIKNWKKIEFKETNSTTREQNILLLNKYKERATTSIIIVLPAGLRDAEIGNDGRWREDEINSLYRKLLSISNTISEATVKTNPEIINVARYSLQTTFLTLYEYIEAMIEGKKKLLMGKWASRRIMNGTRNVITAMDSTTPELGSPGSITVNTTIVGLYQGLKAALPLAIFHLRNGFLSKVFNGPNTPVKLVNKKTLLSEETYLDPEYFDRWMTNEGLEKVISAFSEESMRHSFIEIDGKYLGLIYKGPDGTYKLMQSIDELPETRNKADVTPITFCELLYLSTYQAINGAVAFVTRYPVTGIGSIYPSLTKLRPTVKYETRRELSDLWEPTDNSKIAYDFPITGSAFVNSLSPSSIKLKGLGADFDGDTASFTMTYSDDSKEEVQNFLSMRRAYVGTDGKFISSINVETVQLVLHNMTGKRKT